MDCAQGESYCALRESHCSLGENPGNMRLCYEIVPLYGMIQNVEKNNERRKIKILCLHLLAGASLKNKQKVFAVSASSFIVLRKMSFAMSASSHSFFRNKITFSVTLSIVND